MKKIGLSFMALICALTIFTGCEKKNRTTTKNNKTDNTRVTKSSQTNTPKTTEDIIPVENKILYVASNGKITNDGLTIEKPTTLLNAIEIMNSGDTIRMLKGTYEFNDQVVISKSGSEIKRNSLIADDGVLIDFSNIKTSSKNSGIVFNASYWQIENLEVINSNYYGITINGKGMKVLSCTTYNNNYGGFYIKSSNSSYTNCLSRDNFLQDYSSYGYNIDGTGENNLFDSCVATDNLDSGFLIKSSKAVKFEKCLSFDNGLNGDSGLVFRSGFVFYNKGHIFNNCIAYNNALSGFLVPSVSEKGSYTLTNCEAVNNHQRNYHLKTSNADTVTITNVLSHNSYDGNNDGVIDAINDYVIGKVTNSIFFYDKGYHYERLNNSFNSNVTSLDKINLASYTNKFIINLEIPEEMKEYKDLEAKEAIDTYASKHGIKPDYSSLEYDVIYFKDGILNIYDYLDRSEKFQSELFTKLSIWSPTYFGANVNPKV